MVSSHRILLSIIVPAHNEEKYLPECIESVVAATDKVCSEILIVDDGSTDNTRCVALELANKYPSVRVLFHPKGANCGAAASRNLAIRSAKGKFISFIDADDIMQPHRYGKALELLINDNIDGVLDAVGLVFEDDADAVRWGGTRTLYNNDSSIAPEKFLQASLSGRCAVLTPSLSVRRELFDKCGLYSEKRKLSEDFHLWLRMAACGRFKVGENDEPVVLYRRHEGNTWSPHQYDSFRDLEVVGDVLAWAKGSPWVGEDKVDALEVAFSNKLFHCLQMAQTGRHLTLGLKAAIAAARYKPSLLLGKRYWANLFRLVFPKKVSM